MKKIKNKGWVQTALIQLGDGAWNNDMSQNSPCCESEFSEASLKWSDCSSSIETSKKTKTIRNKHQSQAGIWRERWNESHIIHIKTECIKIQTRMIIWKNISIPVWSFDVILKLDFFPKLMC